MANRAPSFVLQRSIVVARRQLPLRIVSVAGAPRDAGLSLPFDRDLELPLPGFDSIGDALAELAAGKFLVVLDDENRENEGDLIIAADRVSAPAMAFMVEHTSGVICIGMEGKDLDRLRLPLMINSAENEVSAALLLCGPSCMPACAHLSSGNSRHGMNLPP